MFIPLRRHEQAVYAVTMMGENETQRHDSEIMRAPIQVFPGRCKREQLAVSFEVTLVTGERGKALARIQAAAVRDILLWIVNERRHPN